MEDKEVEELQAVAEKDEQLGRLITKLAYTAATLDDTATELEDIAGVMNGNGMHGRDVAGIVSGASGKLNEVATDLKEAAKIMIDHVEVFV